ncbi:aspartic peptidase domain-containing protein [Gloeopeniophorella convolvens]|nr:aspartic peptidase domain-containing protein [Gloeopeniophorella convolvens]
MHLATSFVITALALLSLASPTPEEHASRSTLSIPISKRSSIRRADGTVDPQALVDNVGRTIDKMRHGFAAYLKNTGKEHPFAADLKPGAHRKRATGDVPLTDYQEELWYGSIQVGTPAETFTVDFDTWSSDLFLPASTCGTTCSGHTLYNPGSSTTSADLHKTFSLLYGDGSTVSGEYTSTLSQSAA